MENSLTPELEDYNVISDAEQVADSRIKERDAFVKATSYQIARAVVNHEVTIDEADQVIEEVGNKYPLALDEMATLVGNVHRAEQSGILDIEPNEAQAWQELLARMNPKYSVLRDRNGDISVGLTKNEE